MRGNKLIRFPINSFGYIERPLMLEPANPVRAPVNDVLFKHIGPNAKRKTAFRARRTINQNTGIDGRTDGNPSPPPPPR